MVRHIWRNGQKMYPKGADSMPAPSDNHGTPLFYFGRHQAGRFEIGVYPTPDDNSYELVAEVAFVPERDALSLDDDLYELWIDAIRVGTLAYIYAIPGQPFSDLQLAAHYGASFLAKTADAKRRLSFGRVETSHTIKQRPMI